MKAGKIVSLDFRKRQIMRDLGRMGESAFSQWCASAGLIANSSNVDKTGWDFLVEFDFDAKASLLSTVHNAAFECKVQVKSTDNKDRKLAIKLSNLKRLATAPTPAFIVFIEFDGEDLPQRAFLVHVDQAMCSKILRRLHDAERRGEDHLLHKKTMTITYDESLMLANVSGRALAAAMGEHMGESLSDYVSKKSSFLASAGFEEGFAEMTVSAEGPENIEKMVDMSIGIGPDVDVSDLIAFKKRFGKKGRVPFFHHKDVKLGMHDLKPNDDGVLKFKADKIGSAFSFPVKLYISPFHHVLPEEFRKCRIAGDFFDLIFNPHTNTCTYTFALGEKKFDIRMLLSALGLIELLSRSGQSVYSKLMTKNLPEINFGIKSSGVNFDFQSELQAVKAGLSILSRLNISDPVEISMAQANEYGSRIIEMDTVLGDDAKAFKVEFPAVESPLPVNQEIVCLSFFSTPVGDVWIGTFVSMVGQLYPSQGDRYAMYSTTRTVERIVVRGKGDEMLGEELVAAAEAIEQKYEGQYEVFTLFDKNKFLN